MRPALAVLMMTPGSGRIRDGQMGPGPTKHSAPLLTAVAFINWWEGGGSKAHQFLQLALEADPAYRLARLSDLIIGSGTVVGWNMDKDRLPAPRAMMQAKPDVIRKRRTTAGHSVAT
jgi:hypothetical protein